jgi:chromosome segregation ATPase
VIAELETRLQQRQQENKALADTLALSLEENKQVRQELQAILDAMGHGADTPVAAVASTPGVEAKLRGEIAGYKAVLEQQELHAEQLVKEWNEKEAKLKSLVCDLEGDAGEVCVRVDALEMLVGKAESDVIVLRGHVVERLEKFRERESEIERMEESWFLQVRPQAPSAV